MALSAKQQLFIEAYLTCWNASDAARQAGYATKPNVQGSRLLANASIAAAIQARIAEKAMGADEVLIRLADQARGDASDFLTISEHITRLDLNKARQRGKLHLIKEIRDGKDGLTVKLYDAQAALALLGKHHGLFVDRQEISGTLQVTSDELARARQSAQQWEQETLGDSEQ